MSKYKTIESAPKDGTRIMVYDGEWHCVKWDVDKYETGWLIATYADGTVNSRLTVYRPTHWQPEPGHPDDDR